MDWYDDEDDDADLSSCLDEDAWIAAGIAAIERYLGRHAAFDAWCHDHFRRYGRPPGELA